MRVRCPAKINLNLRVGPPRADGFHSIRSWFVTVGLYDMLSFSPADEISLTCDDPTVPADSRNLVWRAAELLKPVGRGVAIALNKQIPAGGGLGGGSSDAAHTLLALNAFWNLDLSPAKLAELAASLGSDVPFFLNLPSAICEGRGEVVRPVPPPPCVWAILVLPNIPMPTPAVFRRFDELGHFSSLPLREGVGGGVKPYSARSFIAWLSRRASKLLPSPTPSRAGGEEAVRLLATLINDLEPAAFVISPELGRLRETAEAKLGRPVRMSGSGSTLFTLYDAPTPAIDAANWVTAELGVRCLAVPIGVYSRGIPPDDPPGEGNEAPRD